jgi:hypothetical protein
LLLLLLSLLLLLLLVVAVLAFLAVVVVGGVGVAVAVAVVVLLVMLYSKSLKAIQFLGLTLSQSHLQKTDPLPMPVHDKSSTEPRAGTIASLFFGLCQSEARQLPRSIPSAVFFSGTMNRSKKKHAHGNLTSSESASQPPVED